MESLKFWIKTLIPGFPFWCSLISVNFNWTHFKPEGQHIQERRTQHCRTLQDSTVQELDTSISLSQNVLHSTHTPSLPRWYRRICYTGGHACRCWLLWSCCIYPYYLFYQNWNPPGPCRPTHQEHAMLLTCQDHDITSLSCWTSWTV